MEDRNGLAVPVTVEEFGECYGTECPFYHAEAPLGDFIVIPEHCRRTHLEEMSAYEINEREGK